MKKSKSEIYGKVVRTTKMLYGEDFYSQAAKRAKGIKRKGSGFGSTKVGPDGLTGIERARKLGKKGGMARKRNIEQQKAIEAAEESRKYKRPSIEDFKK